MPRCRWLSESWHAEIVFGGSKKLRKPCEISGKSRLTDITYTYVVLTRAVGVSGELRRNCRSVLLPRTSDTKRKEELTVHKVRVPQTLSTDKKTNSGSFFHTISPVKIPGKKTMDVATEVLKEYVVAAVGRNPYKIRRVTYRKTFWSVR